MALAVREIRAMIRGGGAVADHRPLVLAIVAEAAKQEALRVALEPLGWSLVFGHSAAAGMERQQHGRFPVILYDKDCAEHDWREAVRTLSAAGRCGRTILTARTMRRSVCGLRGGSIPAPCAG